MKIEPIIYQFWTGKNQLTPNRIAALKTNINFGVNTILINSTSLEKYILPNFQLHKSYQYLSEVHKSDYLRCYFMHHYGGGYADIKHYSKDNNWKQCFDKLYSNDKIQIIGSQELIGGSPYSYMNTKENIIRLIANGYFIAKPHSPFTTLWFQQVNNILDKKYSQLKRNPAQSPFDRRKDYPLKWAEICGSILHQIEFDFFDKYPGSIDRSLKTGRLYIQYR